MENRKYIMKMAQPATRWWEATPCGNGKIGALVYSNISTETILFNHEELFLPIFEKPQIPKMAAYLPKYRKLLEVGKCHEADKYWRAALKKEGWPDFVYTNPQHPAFDLKIYQKFNDLFSDYSRELNMASGEAVTKWTAEKKIWKRSVFVSRADDAAFIKLSCSETESIFAEIELKPHEFRTGRYPVKLTREELPLSFEQTCSKNVLRIKGLYTDGSGYVGTAKITFEGGAISVHGNRIVISGASEVLIAVRIDISDKTDTIEHTFPTESYTELLERHKRIHGELFKRVTFSLESENCDITNEELINRIYSGVIPETVYERLFCYGRYLLISSTGGKLPPNLQGIWNGEYLPPWSCAYTLDENIQMIHWQALPGKMPELMEQYFKFVEDSIPQWEENAKSFYGCKGILAPISQGNHAAICENMPYLMQTCMAGWMARDFYLYYQYTGDKDFLLKRALPVMEKAAEFYVDFSYEGEDGKLIICPSMSPENNPTVTEEGEKNDPWLRASVNPTIDIAVFRELLKNICKSYKVFGINDEKYAQYSDILKKLPKYELDCNGAFREWLHDKYGEHYRHRHASHLYPVYPGDEIHEKSDRVLFKGCQTALELKMDNNMESMTCWGYVHMAHCLNRLNEPQKAMKCLEYAVKGCLGKNFFMYINDYRGMGIAESFVGGRTYDDPVFQMDSNAGITSLITQMIVDSYSGYIRILSGVPAEWKKGSLRNVRCVGCVELCVEWYLDEQEISVTAAAEEDTAFNLSMPKWIKTITVSGYEHSGNSIDVKMKNGEKLAFYAKG